MKRRFKEENKIKRTLTVVAPFSAIIDWTLTIINTISVRARSTVLAWIVIRARVWIWTWRYGDVCG